MTHPPEARPARDIDVLDISDLRFPGGTSHSIVEEIRAQSSVGWRTGLIHLNGPLVSRVRPFNPLIAAEIRGGRAVLIIGDEPVRARLTVVRHPAVLQHAAAQLPPVSTDALVVVANAGPHDIDGHQHYDPARVHRIATEVFGVEPRWAPIGPEVRASIADAVPAGSLLERDWVNIIDVDAWYTPRTAWQAEVPVIGRHSRNSPQKWPNDRSVLTAVYPVDGSTLVRVLGGAEPAANVLRAPLPPSWEVHPFGALSPREFLAGLDFFVYYHDPRWIEAFGRTILEALASGVPAVLPPHFRELFGDAAVYAEPDEVRNVIARLRADRPAWQRQVERGLNGARSRFGYEAHRARVVEVGGLPAPSRAVRAPADEAPRRERLLLISSNGSGMGHLTRLLAYARRAEPELEPHFLSLSQAVGVVGHFGYPYEYAPSTGATGLAPRSWHPVFVDRVADVLERIDPAVVVFDGTWPYDGIRLLRESHPRPRWVWSRRGLWKAGRNHEQLSKDVWFDAVIEPGDFAGPLDHGATRDAPALRVPPVTLLDTDDLTDRAGARRALGLPEDGPLALLTLGAGNINDTSQDTGAAVAALSSLGVGVCVTRTQISTQGRAPDGVHTVQHFPLSQHYRAFDLAISATGYNSFHELLRFGVPTLFVPNLSTALDDTGARAHHAAQQGWAHQLPSVTVDTARLLLADLLERGPSMVARVAEQDPGNGAPAASEHLMAIVGGKTRV